MNTPGEATPAGRRGLPWKRIGLAVAALAAVAVLLVLGRRLGHYVPAFRDWVAGLGVWGPVVFILGYAAAAVAFVPGAPLTLAAGAAFGLVRGTIYAWIGATLGASAAFLVARYAARSWVERRLEELPRLRAVDRAVGREGGKIVALLRLSPAFPFNLLNYALGLTDVRFPAYLLACLAMLPGTLLYVYYGHVGRTALEGGQTVWDWVLVGVGLLAILAVTVVITQKAKQALAERTALDPAEAGAEGDR
jgi:uncharacterized membrane protein YdjX (TVP38/TMEM64 family)